MKKYYNQLFLFGTLLFLSTSCEKEALLTSLAVVQFPSGFQASSTSVLVNSQNLSANVMNLSWPEVKYPIAAPVTYALEFDVLADTFGANAWVNSLRVEVGEDVLSKSLLGNTLNDMALNLGLAAGEQGSIVVRVEANLDHKTYSEAIELKITPYVSQIIYPQIYVTGAYQAWDNSTAASLPAIAAGIYQGFLSFPSTQSRDFKLITDRTGTKFYGGNGGNLVEGSTSNPTVPAYGSYKINVNLNTLTYTTTAYSWGIIGTATAGGWNNSTAMSYDYVLNVWKYRGPLTAGALKFRLNDAWTINYGSKNSTDGIIYLDNPGAYDLAEAGNYEVVFAVNDAAISTIAIANFPATGTYTVTKI